ncbi:putative protein phosphatase 2C 39 [Camellia lanceoleosa]|uniref:Uncharacterized protein n=1 Tax=Camellia lanceoleosa TaxID=1840588 RepID=A0ACC0I6T2_9ERIC|nr:putative protein phosphatase 2C 39 [Camellia lanceoleosa]
MTGREIHLKMKEKVGLGSSADIGKGKSKMSKHVTHGYHLVKGKSSHPMEDYVVAEFKQVEEHKLGLFAIFDGHLSHDIPDHLRSHLFVNILNEDGVAKQLSIDHEPSKERTYIEARGGFVSKFLGDVPRVDGQLAIARAFGDKSLKKHLSSEPDVSLEIVDKDTEFVILASDGIWKADWTFWYQVMTNQEAVECIRNIKDAKAAAKHLTCS